MINVDYTTVREIQRNPKKISEEVNNADKSYVVMSNNRPQFVIVGLNNFSKLQSSQEQEKKTSLISLLDWAEKANLDLPNDLSENHDVYLWKQSSKSPKK